MIVVIPDNPADERFAKLTAKYLNDRFMSGIHFHRADMELFRRAMFERLPTMDEVDDVLRRALRDTLTDSAQRHGPSHPSSSGGELC